MTRRRPPKPPARKARTDHETPQRISDLIGLWGLSAATLRRLLSRARQMHEQLDRPKGPDRVLEGRIVANLFFEDSTRTRTSFSVAAKRLGAGVVDLMGFASSVNKGETLVDTALNVEAMGVDAITVRAKQAGSAQLIAAAVRCPVVNAGDGRHEHPTQGLLDAYTLAHAHGRLDGMDLSGLTVAIVGDVASSRVARSAIAAMTALGARIVCVGPPGLAPAALGELGCATSVELDPVLGGVDAVMMLRMQFERHDGGQAEKAAEGGAKPSGVIASVREYRELYALTAARAAGMKKGAIVMHPGPMNRGLEIDGPVADGPRSVILKQVTHGVAVRMAVLAELIVK